MRLLFDTHLMLWWAGKHPRLPEALRELAETAESVYFSRASMWEIAIKVSMGRLKLDVDQFSGSIERHGFEWLEIKDAHLRAVATLPFIGDHRDPFDRLLVAQSMTEPLLLLTSDANLTRYGTTVRLVS